MSEENSTNLERQDDQELVTISDAVDELIDEIMDDQTDGRDVENSTPSQEPSSEPSDEGMDEAKATDVSSAETLDELVDILLDDDGGEDTGEPPQDAKSDGENPNEQDERDDWGDGSFVSDSAFAASLSVIGAQQDEARVHDEPYRHKHATDDSLVAMPTSASVITQGPVTAPADGRRQGERRYQTSLVAMFACLFVGLAMGVVTTFLGTRALSGKADVPDDTVAEAMPTKVSKKELGMEMARYDYDGKTYVLSVRDVIELTGSLDSMEGDDGYAVPSSEKAVEAVRNAVVFSEAKKHGITVDEGDILDYVSETYGVPTVDELSQQVGIDVSDAKRQLRDRLIVKRLKDEVTGTTSLIPLTEPMIPDNGDSSAYDVRYAEYIKSLAGDEWNSESNTWNNPDGSFAKAFGENSFNGNEASYDMARIAYDVVNSRNNEIRSSVDKAWSEYVNDLFRRVSVTICTLSR